MAPPYDVITADDQRRYYQQDPRNVVRLIAGEVKTTDHPGDNKYTRAAGFFQEWLQSGVLRREPSPCFYAYRQTFTVPGAAEMRSRTGILGVVELEPFGANVLAHERTHARPKADRLSLTQAVRANLSPVFALYEDGSGRLRQLLAGTTGGSARFSITTDAGEQHTVWCLRGEENLTSIAHALKPSPLFIADGHHRYETALNFRDKQRREYPEATEDAAFNYVLMLLIDADDPGLLILPTHRVLRDLEGFDGRTFLKRLARRHRVTRRGDRRSLVGAMRELVPEHRVGMALPGGELATVDIATPGSAADPVQSLDVTALHGEILERELGLHEGILESERHLTYSRDANSVVDQVERGQAQAAFLLRPPSVADVLAVARAGQVMPQKSTYFYPKPLSGIVFNPLDPPFRITMG